jgi:hypothetical protein
MFSEAEVDYLKTQRLARVATASPKKGVPEVSQSLSYQHSRGNGIPEDELFR